MLPEYNVSAELSSNSAFLDCFFTLSGVKLKVEIIKLLYFYMKKWIKLKSI